MKKVVLYAVILLLLVDVVITIFSRSTQAKSSRSIVDESQQTEYTVIIDTAYTFDPNREITQQDIDDATLEMMEDAKYYSENPL